MNKIIAVMLPLTILILLQGCASTEDIAPESAEITVHFRAADGQFTTVDGEETLSWNITKAFACIGEIGMHWDWYSTQSQRTMLRHDIPGGKISPKIYDYYGVDFMKDTKIQTLQVDPALYNHVHMMMTPAVSDTVKNISTAPELKTHSYYFEGTVQKGDITKNFTLYSDSLYKENDLGDMQFELQIYNGDSYNFNLTAPLQNWFNTLTWHDLGGDTLSNVTVSKTTPFSIGAKKFETIMTSDNSFDFKPQKVAK